MEPLRRPRGKVNLGELAAVCVQNVNSTKLVEFQAGELAQRITEVPGRHVDIFGAHQRANAGAVVALLHLVPPALALVLHHGRLIQKDPRARPEQVKQRYPRLCGSRGDRREELPTRENRRLSGACRNPNPEFGGLFAAFELRPGQARAREPRVDGGKDILGDRRFSERQQERLVQRRGRALGIGIEAPDGLYLVAEEVNPHRAVHLR